MPFDCVFFTQPSVPFAEQPILVMTCSLLLFIYICWFFCCNADGGWRVLCLLYNDGVFPHNPYKKIERTMRTKCHQLFSFPPWLSIPTRISQIDPHRNSNPTWSYKVFRWPVLKNKVHQTILITPFFVNQCLQLECESQHPCTNLESKSFFDNSTNSLQNDPLK